MDVLIPTIEHDGPLTIAIGSSRLTKTWKNKEMPWSGFVARLSRTNRTGETIAEYMALPKARVRARTPE